MVITDTGVEDLVYNDFYIEAGAQVEIIAGCGIHNDGGQESRHDGIHTFHVGKDASLIYTEKHYGQGDGNGKRVLNPTTVLHLEEGAQCTLDTTQIKGVDSTIRKTEAYLHKNAKLMVLEKLMTHGQPNRPFRYGRVFGGGERRSSDHLPFRGSRGFHPGIPPQSHRQRGL